MSDSIRLACKIILKRDFPVLLAKKNVVGIAFGYKIINNIQSTNPCIKFFVSTKEPDSELSEEDLIPKVYEGFKTDVIQVGKLSYSSLIEKNLPLKIGYSIGPINVPDTASFGCLVKDCKDNFYILSTNHALSSFGTLPIGTPIIHPAIGDGGKYPNDLIALLCKKIPLFSSEEYTYVNYVDCAIAKIINKDLISNKIFLVGDIKGISNPELNLNVKKVGRTTELTTGKVIALDAIIALEDFNGFEQIFHDQIITTYMSTKGDSGSLLLNKDNNAIGLLFANGDSISIANSIKTVLTSLNVQLIIS